MQPIYIETERLIIRQFCQQDANAYYQLLAHPKVHCFADEKPESIDKIREKIRELQTLDDGSELSVCLKETGEWIGTLFGVWENGRDTFCVCWNFLPSHCGKGYAFEAAKAYLDFLFLQMGARRIYAYVEEDNLPSQRLCQKLGMRREGTFLEFISFVNNPDGTPLYENTSQFAILKKEWESRSSCQ